MEDEYACSNPKGTSHHPESNTPIATVETAHHRMRARGSWTAVRSPRQMCSAESAIPQRAGRSSTTVRTAAPPKAYMPGTMCERMQTASTIAAQPRYLPSRTAQAKSPRNRMASDRLNE